MPHAKRRSLRTRMITLVLIPSTALLALWAVFTTVLATDIRDLRGTANLTEEVGKPVVDVIDHLQQERHATTAATDQPNSSNNERLSQARQETDQAVQALGGSLSEFDGAALPQQALDFQVALNGLGQHRHDVATLDHEADVIEEAALPYDRLIESGIRVWDSAAERADPALVPHLRSLTSLMRARELLNQQDTILAHAVATDTFTPQAHARFASAAGAQQHTWSRVDAELGEERGEDYEELAGSFQLENVTLLQETVIGTPSSGTGARVPVNAQTWLGAAEALDARMREVEQGRMERVVELGRSQATDLLRGALVISVPALLAALASTLVAVAGSQRLGRRLQELRTETLHYARVRLPEVTARLRGGGSVEVDTEAPRLAVAERDELGQVAEAFNDAQRAAVTAAVEEAQVRAGVRNMFRNIGRRTQSLVHRQLALLDRLERGETDPQALESLYRIDHFSTQMRRNAENLMLLSGDRPARRSAATVGLHESVRAAASEIEDYARVRVLSLPQVALHGTAGSDLVRLVAELLENAASFSPPGIEVTVGGRSVEGGWCLVEVEDRGLGMTSSQLESANALLADPPRFDLARMREDSQLGLFVVATIAGRHGFEVRLRASPFLGTRASVRIPGSVVAERTGDTGPLLRSELVGSTGPNPEVPERAPRGPLPSPAAEGGTYKGLPRRRRRSGVGGGAEPSGGSSSGPGGPSMPADSSGGSEDAQNSNRNRATGGQRSLSEIRSMMSAFQAGTERGRAESADAEGEEGVPERGAHHDESAEG
ncbi:sensor histidine kinase [Nocardiopsis oceani]